MRNPTVFIGDDYVSFTFDPEPGTAYLGVSSVYADVSGRLHVSVKLEKNKKKVEAKKKHDAKLIKQVVKALKYTPRAKGII